MARVLVVEDEPSIRELLRYTLSRDGHTVAEAADGVSALRAFEDEPPELIILDIVIPEPDGLEVCRRVRQSSDVPILFLSSRDEELDRILGLELGGDDYVTKPFSPRELAARVKAMLRRGRGARGTGDDETPLRAGRLTIDTGRHTCHWDEHELRLTATEFMLLRCLAIAPGRVFSREELVERAYGHGHHITERTVDSHIRRIRRKLAGVDADPIETVYGVGYRLRDEGAG